MAMVYIKYGLYKKALTGHSTCIKHFLTSKWNMRYVGCVYDGNIFLFYFSKTCGRHIHIPLNV